MGEQHQRFLERLAASSRAVFVVARLQHERGRTVEIAPLRFAPTAADAKDYLDGGDLFVVRRNRIEVKHLGVSFTGRDDWPHPHVFVSNEAKVERSPDVFAYVSVSKDLGCIAIIDHATRPDWYVVEGLVRNTGNIERNYACPLRLVTFETIPAEWR